uniref:Uncharacterized protein n=1 Tax=Anguilla anguilla TaxID=7936 RepID=A0A0E9U6M5_ANGAN
MPDGAREYPLLCPRASVLIRIYQTKVEGVKQFPGGDVTPVPVIHGERQEFRELVLQRPGARGGPGVP